MTSITIHDEATRLVLLYALWDTASSAVGEEALNNDLFNCGWERISWVFGIKEEGTDPFDAAGARLAVLAAMRAGVQSVEAAAIGSTVDVPLDGPALAEKLSSCKDWIEDCTEGRALLDADETRHVLTCRDGAVRLVGELTAGAVA